MSGYAYFEDINVGLLRLWGKRRGLKVLDVGCGFATTSAEIQRLSNEVTGIDASEAAITVARERIAEVIAADLEDGAAVARALGDRRFDVIVFADVLEHLPRPLPVLREYLRYLAPGGSVIVSLPNVGLWSVRLQLLAGRFEYEDAGVLDRTHFRFFTRRTARKLLEEAGLTIVRKTYNPGLVRPFVPLAKKLLARGEGSGDPRVLLESAPHRAYLNIVHPVERVIAAAWPGALAFQLIFEAKRA